jgi:hypothetical protein
VPAFGVSAAGTPVVNIKCGCPAANIRRDWVFQLFTNLDCCGDGPSRAREGNILLFPLTNLLTPICSLPKGTDFSFCRPVIRNISNYSLSDLRVLLTDQRCDGGGGSSRSGSGPCIVAGGVTAAAAAAAAVANPASGRCQ